MLKSLYFCLSQSDVCYCIQVSAREVCDKSGSVNTEVISIHSSPTRPDLSELEEKSKSDTVSPGSNSLSISSEIVVNKV